MEKRQSGFGLLEVVISCMILITVVGAVVALGTASVRGGLTASDKTTAYNLVQECLEGVRAARNTTWLDTSSNEWYSKMLSNLNTNTVDLALSGSNSCESKIGAKAIGSPVVDYTRTLSISEVPWYTQVVPFSNTDPKTIIKKVTVTVSWESGSGLKNMSASTYLSDWKTID